MFHRQRSRRQKTKEQKTEDKGAEDRRERSRRQKSRRQKRKEQKTEDKGAAQCAPYLGDNNEDGHDAHPSKSPQVKHPPAQSVHQRDRHQGHHHHDRPHSQVCVLGL